MSEDSLTDSDEHLLENLKLVENGYFHPNPEKCVTGAYVKVGYFEREAVC